MDQGQRIFDYNLGSVSLSSEELNKFIQMRNASFNANVDRTFDSYIQRSNEEYSKATRLEFETKYYNNLNDTAKAEYDSNRNNWSSSDALNFWNNQKIEDDSYNASLRNWNIANETQSKRDSIQEQINSVQNQINSVQEKLNALDPNDSGYEYNKLNYQNELDYYNSQNERYKNDLKNTVSRFSFEDKSQFDYFQTMLGDNNISYASTAGQINGQYVILVNEGYTSQIKNLSSKYEDMSISYYHEKSVDKNLTFNTTSSVVREDGSIILNQNKDQRDLGGEILYSTFVNPAMQMGMREIATTMNVLQRVGNSFSEKTSVFSHSSVLDRSYEQNFQVLENQNKRIEYLEKKYGISRDDLYDSKRSLGVAQSDDAQDIRFLAKNEFETHELEKLMKDRDSLDFLSQKYDISFNITKQDNTISSLETGHLGLNSSNMTEFSQKINNINAKLLDDLQGKLVYKGKSMIVNGRLDIDLLRRSGITAKDLGISEAEFKILKDCASWDGKGALLMSGMSLMGKIMSKANKYGEGQDFSWYYELQSNIDRTMKIKQGIENLRKFSREMDLSDFKLALRSKRNNVVSKKNAEKIKTTKKKLDSVKNKHLSSSIEKARKREERRLLAKQRFEKTAYGRLNKAFNTAKTKVAEKTLIGKIASKAFTLIKGACTTALKFVAIAGSIFACVASVIFMVVVLIISIPSFFEVSTIEETIVYNLYEYGMQLEDEWIEGLKDTDKYYKHRDELAYGKNWLYWESLNGENQLVRYINSKVDKARATSVNAIYINPFDFTPKASIQDDVEHKIKDFDGGVNVEIISNFNIDIHYEDDKIILGDEHWTYGGGHTCNIKDMICMLDVMMGFDTTGDWGDNLMTEGVAQNTVKDAWKKLSHGAKLLGLGIASTYDDDAYGKWAEEQANGSGSVGYLQLEGYMRTLFAMSHQEQIELEVVSFPVIKNTDGSGYVSMSSDGKGLQMAYNDILTECPGGEFDLDDDGSGHEIHACCSYDDFRPFLYDYGVSSVPKQMKIGIEGDDGKMHVVDKQVYWNGDSPCISSGVIALNSSTGNANNQYFDQVKNNDHWDYNDSGKSTLVNDKKWDEMTDSERSDHDSKGEGTNVTWTVESDFSYNSPDQWFKMTKVTEIWSSRQSWEVTGSHTEYRDDDCEEYIDENGEIAYRCGGHKVDDWGYVTRYTKTIQTEYVYWSEKDTCKGHKGYYCGGHLRCNVTGIVYSFKEKDILFANDTLDEEGYVLTPMIGEYTDKYGDVQGMDVDYSTFDMAKATGLNVAKGYDFATPDLDGVWAYSNQVPENTGALLNKARLWTDIFSVDYTIQYGRGQFRHNDYRQFEGWTKDNMLFALMKYGQNWNEMYGFDIATEMGFGEMSYEDIRAIDTALADKYGDDYGTIRKHVVNLALTAVGNGSYDSNEHHWHAYTMTKHGSYTCTASDCSGFASYPLLQTEKDLQIKLNEPYDSHGLAFSCSELSGFENGMDKTEAIHATSVYKDGTAVVNSDYSNCKPGDIISKVVGQEGQGLNHSVVFIGVLDEDLTLPSGKVIRAGKPMEVDCTTITEGGNIYFRSFGSTVDAGGYFPWSIMYNWDTEYANGNRSLWVRDITYGIDGN